MDLKNIDTKSINVHLDFTSKIFIYLCVMTLIAFIDDMGDLSEAIIMVILFSYVLIPFLFFKER